MAWGDVVRRDASSLLLLLLWCNTGRQSLGWPAQPCSAAALQQPSWASWPCWPLMYLAVACCRWRTWRHFLSSVESVRSSDVSKLLIYSHILMKRSVHTGCIVSCHALLSYRWLSFVEKFISILCKCCTCILKLSLSLHRTVQPIRSSFVWYIAVTVTELVHCVAGCSQMKSWQLWTSIGTAKKKFAHLLLACW